MTKQDKRARQADAARRRLGRRVKKTVIWIVVAAAVGGLAYGISQTSGVRFGESDLAVIDFSGLSSAQKKTALEAANAARCTCGCGMDLAQCVSTDSTCPVRTSNIERIKKMVDQARTSSD